MDVCLSFLLLPKSFEINKIFNEDEGWGLSENLTQA